jgi:hypothetical protein
MSKVKGLTSGEDLTVRPTAEEEGEREGKRILLFVMSSPPLNHGINPL